MNAAAFTEVEFSQVLEFLRCACTVAAVAIISRRLAEAESELERDALAQTLLKIVGMEPSRSPARAGFGQEAYMHQFE